MNACELTLGITALANAIVSELSDDDLTLMAAVFTQLGDTLATIAVQRLRGDQKTGGLPNPSPDTSEKGS